MEILNNMSVSFNQTLVSDRYRQEVEDNLTWLRSRANKSIPIDDNLKARWAGDFHGLLQELGVPEDLFYVVTRINELDSSNDDLEELITVLIPRESDIEIIAASAKKYK